MLLGLPIAHALIFRQVRHQPPVKAGQCYWAKCQTTDVVDVVTVSELVLYTGNSDYFLQLPDHFESSHLRPLILDYDRKRAANPTRPWFKKCDWLGCQRVGVITSPGAVSFSLVGMLLPWLTC